MLNFISTWISATPIVYTGFGIIYLIAKLSHNHSFVLDGYWSTVNFYFGILFLIGFLIVAIMEEVAQWF
jgi:hypothetical protein